MSLLHYHSELSLRIMGLFSSSFYCLASESKVNANAFAQLFPFTMCLNLTNMCDAREADLKTADPAGLAVNKNGTPRSMRRNSAFFEFHFLDCGMSNV